MATANVSEVTPTLVDSDGNAHDLDGVVVVRRKITASYTMTFKKGSPDSVVYPKDGEIPVVEITNFPAFDLEVTSVNSEVLTGGERDAYLKDAEKKNEELKTQNELLKRLESGDESAMLEVLFGKDFASEIDHL